MTLLTKLGLSVLGGGSVVAGGYGTYELIRPKTIADQLKWNGKELLDVNKSTYEDGQDPWEQLYAKYNPSGTPENKDKFLGEDPSINSKEDLKRKCEKVFSLLLTRENENNLKQSGFWCVKNSEKLKETQ